MNILMVGRGVIATLYAWALEKAGHKVDFYVRPGRAAQYGTSVNLEIRDGRISSAENLVTERWLITMREDLNADHDYDLIMVSVFYHQLSDVIAFLRTRIGKATVLIFNNLWTDPQEAVSDLPTEQVVWGFPGGGGGFFGTNLLKGGILKTLFMGRIGNSKRSARYQAVYEMFRSAGFSVSESKDFRGWLWFHFVLEAALAVQALKVGGYSNVFSSAPQLKATILLMREMLPVLKAKGEKPNPGVTILLNLPAGLLGCIGQKVLSGDRLESFNTVKQLDASGHASYELLSRYPREVLADAHRLGVALPRLTTLAAFFNTK
ncbi:MAG: ketopantoate reductase [Anaerolineae bacterium]|nr:ketopantoate reductase [Anaerolineae bacterium]